jgi:ADP-ribose pyrophosphatase
MEDEAAFLRDCLAGSDVQLSAAEAAMLRADIAALMGIFSADQIRARLPMMAVRACARVRAACSSPEAGRTVTLAGVNTPYAAFFSVEEFDLTHTRFDGAQSRPLRRAALVSGDAVTVLPYDPIRRRVLLVQQFRTGPLARGDSDPWQYEAIAGRIDGGETPEDAARREAYEEAGLTLNDLHFVAGYYPSPGILSEYLYSYVALCDLPDSAAGIFGLDTEGEDIKSHLLDVDELLARMANGAQGSNGPLILTALWLGQNLHRFDKNSPR